MINWILDRLSRYDTRGAYGLTRLTDASGKDHFFKQHKIVSVVDCNGNTDSCVATYELPDGSLRTIRVNLKAVTVVATLSARRVDRFPRGCFPYKRDK